MNLDELTKQLSWFARIVGWLVFLGLVIYVFRLLKSIG